MPSTVRTTGVVHDPAYASGLVVCSANIPDKVAIAMDTQMDDGLPATGTVRAMLKATPNPAIAAAAAAGYAETGTNVYALCRSL